MRRGGDTKKPSRFEREYVVLVSLRRTLERLIRHYSRPTQRWEQCQRAKEEVAQELAILKAAMAGDSDALRFRRTRKSSADPSYDPDDV